MSNQASRNSDSTYFVQDLEEFEQDNLLKWDAVGHQVVNSGLQSLNDGELTADKIIVGEIEAEGGNPLCIEGIVEFDKQGTDANISYGQACDPNITDINAFYESKRDVNIFYKADTDGVAMNDNPVITLTRKNNIFGSQISMTNTATEFKIQVGSDTSEAANPDIAFYTGANYPITSGIPNFSTASEAMRIDGTTQNVDISNVLTVDTVNEKTPGAGVSIENIILQDSYIELADVSAPANPADGEGRLYKKTGNDGIYWKPDSGGAEVDLSDTGGDVFGPLGSTDNAIVRFDGTGGTQVQDSGVLIDDSDNLSIPTGAALGSDTINETTLGAGVTIDGVLIKDGNITLPTGVDTITAGIINPIAAAVDVNSVYMFDGYIQLDDVSEPGARNNGEGVLYKLTGDDGLWWKADMGGTPVDLTAGGITGPVSSTDNAIVRFDGTGGDTAQNSLVTISDTGVITVPSGTGLGFSGAAQTLDFYDEWQDTVTFTATGFSQSVSVRLTRIGRGVMARIGGTGYVQDTVTANVVISCAAATVPADYRPGTTSCISFLMTRNGTGESGQLAMVSDGSIQIGRISDVGSTTPDGVGSANPEVDWATFSFYYHVA